jgi:hypothetical protein
MSNESEQPEPEPQRRADKVSAKTIEFIQRISESHNQVCAVIQSNPDIAGARQMRLTPQTMHDLYVAFLLAFDDITEVAAHHQRESSRMRAEFETQFLRNVELNEILFECWRILYPTGTPNVDAPAMLRDELAHKMKQMRGEIAELRKEGKEQLRVIRRSHENLATELRNERTGATGDMQELATRAATYHDAINCALRVLIEAPSPVEGRKEAIVILGEAQRTRKQ